MKTLTKKLMTWMTICFSFVTHLTGCPTCIGRLNQGDEPFFSNRYYQNITQSLNATNPDNALEVKDELGDADEESD